MADVDLSGTDRLYPEHDRTSCSDEHPVNAQAAGSHGCARCTSIAMARGEAAEARAERLAEALREIEALSPLVGVSAARTIARALLREQEEGNG